MKKRLKYGRLYWMPLEAKDLGRDFIWRVLNKLGFKYIPFTLRFYDELYLREDISKYSRRLIYECRKYGVTTYVVQEGPVIHRRQAIFSHIPLYADIFLCPEENYELWIKEGMPKEKIKVYDMQKFDKNDYKGVVFLNPFLTWKQPGSATDKGHSNVKIAETIHKMLSKDVVFRPHNTNSELIVPLLPSHRIVWDKIEHLIKRYDKIYAFSDSTIARDCEKVGKESKILDENVDGLWNNKKIFNRKIISNDMTDKKDSYSGVVFLEPFSIWDYIPYTWQKYYFNTKVLKAIYNMLDADVVFKPHQCSPELITPFLPPHRIIWDTAEELIRKYNKIYCFSNSSITKDCEMLGKEYEILDKDDIK